ncbi:MAG: hypothetical protein PF541_09055 [Prolixibacteraceae bacterium]|jgi:predicted glycoside hydrolase/deacetylase ChbG (UPF0249 family)|nr:hypothetical protein [Prolixibacteraceae bacterium]
MSLPQIQHTNINEYLNREDIVRETIDQIRRDFDVFGMEITFSGKLDNVYHEMHPQVKALLDQLLAGNSEQLYTLLYRIDISDQSIINAAQELSQYNHVEVIAHQIILRDLQKVLTRRYFKEESQNKKIE